MECDCSYGGRRLTGPRALPEPCLKPPCDAPEECAGLGYCSIRDRAAAAGLIPHRKAEWKRRRAAKRKADLLGAED
jgi:hypothetical protein